jgi:hypothetical protein
MQNSIPSDQLTQRQLDRLAAQRYLYSRAKTLLAAQIILAVPCVVIWSVIVAFIPALKVFAALWGVIILLLDLFVFEPLQRSWKQEAAKIQELFDCDVLQISRHDFKIGNNPEPERIAEASEKYKRMDPEYSALKGWYPDVVGQVPLYPARIICQRTNCWWDAKLRRRYAAGLVVTLAALTILVFAIGLVGGMSLEKFILAVIVPLIPAFQLGIREAKRNIETAETLDALKAQGIHLKRDTVCPQLLSAMIGRRFRGRGKSSMFAKTVSKRSGNPRRKNRAAGVVPSAARQSKLCSTVHTL